MEHTPTPSVLETHTRELGILIRGIIIGAVVISLVWIALLLLRVIT